MFQEVLVQIAQKSLPDLSSIPGGGRIHTARLGTLISLLQYTLLTTCPHLMYNLYGRRSETCGLPEGKGLLQWLIGPCSQER